MAATTTLASLLSDLCEETDLGLVLTGIDPDNVAGTAITLADSYGVAPTTGAVIPINSPIIFTSPIDGGTATASGTTTVTDSSKAWTVDEWIGFVITMGGWRATITDSDATSVTFAALDAAPTVGKYSIEYGSSYVSNYVASTGVISMKPTLGTLNAAMVKPFTAIIGDPVLRHPRYLTQAISRANQKCRRWQKVPLTYVPDGEMLGAVASFWTGSGTESYVSLAAPGTAGAQVLNLAHTGATTAQSNTIPAHASDTWFFETAIRSVTAGGVTAGLVVYDVTNSAAITPTYETGDGDTTSNAFTTQRGAFTIPATCDQIAFRLTIDASGDVQMAPIIAYPQGAKSFPFTNRVLGERIGNYFYAYGGGTDRGPDERWYSEPLTTGGAEVVYSNNGDHMVATFNFTPAGPVYYDELIYGGALTAMADTVTFPADQVKLWARAELYDFLMRGEMRGVKRMENGTSLPSVWRPLRNAAYKSAKWSSFEPELVNVPGRR